MKLPGPSPKNWTSPVNGFAPSNPDNESGVWVGRGGIVGLDVGVIVDVDVGG